MEPAAVQIDEIEEQSEPAAVLYEDGDSFEPLPTESAGAFHVAEPVVGVVAEPSGSDTPAGVIDDGEPYADDVTPGSDIDMSDEVGRGDDLEDIDDGEEVGYDEDTTDVEGTAGDEGTGYRDDVADEEDVEYVEDVGYDEDDTGHDVGEYDGGDFADSESVDSESADEEGIDGGYGDDTAETQEYDGDLDDRTKALVAAVMGPGGDEAQIPPPGNKKGILVAAVVVVVLLIGGGIALAVGGGKSDKAGDKVETAAPVTTPTTTPTDGDDSVTSTDPSVESPDVPPEESTTSTTTEEATTSTTAGVTTTTQMDFPVQPPTPQNPTPTVTAPTAPAHIRVTPAGGNISIAKNGSFSIKLSNGGGSDGQFQVNAVGLAGSTSGVLAPGQEAVVLITDTAGVPQASCSVYVSVSASGAPNIKICVTVG